MDEQKIVNELNITESHEKEFVKKVLYVNPEIKFNTLKKNLSIHNITYNFYSADNFEDVYEFWEKPKKICNCEICSELIKKKESIIKSTENKIKQKNINKFNKKIKNFLNKYYTNFSKKDVTISNEKKIIKFLKNMSNDTVNLADKNKFFKHNTKLSKQLYDFYINFRTQLLFKQLSKKFENDSVKIKKEYNNIYELLFEYPIKPINNIINDYFKSLIKHEKKDFKQIKSVHKKYRYLINQSINIQKYHDFFVEARSKNRNITFYMGETCSGKTYKAHNQLADADTGLYLAPLRLLALEGQEEQFKRNVICSFLTGEEQDFIKGSTHLSSTIEMLNTKQEIKTAVIDEIQMIGDSQRGWAWAQALLGVPADNIILTGSSNSLNIVQQICNVLEEPLEIINLERLTQLKVMEEPISFDDFEKKDCIVAFSRRDVLRIKYEIEKMGFNVSVIYGGLPPEVRREESRRFNSNETDILVATDAIAMGLNLPIRRVIFYTTYKFYNRKEHPLTISEIRQIGGRAGRYGKEKTGYVAAFNNKDLDNIKSAFKSKIPEVEKAFIIPTIEHIEIISQITNTKKISDIFKYFRKYVQINSDLFQLSDLSELIYKSKQLNHITDLKTAFTFAVAPVDVKSELVFNYYKDYIDNVTQNKTVNPPMLSDLRNQNFNEINNMRNLESFIKVCNLYNWLHFRYPEHFFDIETCSIEKNKAISKVITILNSENLIKKCRFCGRHLPLDFKFNICNICHHKTYRKSKKRYFRKNSYKKNK